MAGWATKIAADQLLDAMRKPDGTYRSYDEMIAEGIPTKYTGKYESPSEICGIKSLSYIIPPVFSQSVLFEPASFLP